MVCFNLEVTFGFRLRNRGLWILPGLGALSILVLNGGSGDRFVLLDAALNGLLWWLIAVFIDRLIYRFRKRPAAKEVQQTLTCAVCGEELREKTQFCPHCGFTTDQVGETDVSRPEPSQGTTSPRADPAPHSQETRSVRQPKRPLLILIMVLGGLVLIGFVLLQFIRDPELPTTATAPTTTTNTVPSTTRAPSTTTPKASAVNTKTHKFQEGDTLYQLASEHLCDGQRWSEIAELNGIHWTQTGTIPDGLFIKIPVETCTATTTRAPSGTYSSTTTSARTYTFSAAERDSLRMYCGVTKKDSVRAPDAALLTSVGMAIDQCYRMVATIIGSSGHESHCNYSKAKKLIDDLVYFSAEWPILIERECGSYP